MEKFLFRLPPDLAVLAELRRDLSVWLRQLDDVFSEQQVVDVVLATHEAAANAIEHSDDPFGSGQVNAWLVDGLLTVEVGDSGNWTTERPVVGERGRGLILIESLVDEVRIKKNPRGTTLRLVHRGAQASASSRVWHQVALGHSQSHSRRRDLRETDRAVKPDAVCPLRRPRLRHRPHLLGRIPLPRSPGRCGSGTETLAPSDP